LARDNDCVLLGYIYLAFERTMLVLFLPTLHRLMDFDPHVIFFARLNE